MLLNPKMLSRFDGLKASGLLPSPKGAALAVFKLTQQDDTTSSELAHAVEADPALVARVIKLANHCQMSGARPILAMPDAIHILGINAVRGLALGSSLMADRQRTRCRGFDFDRFWSYSLACAVAMRTFAAHSHIIQGDEGFTLGLLSRMGELGLAGLFPDEYSKLLNAQRAELLAQEHRAFAFDHAELTAALLLDWGFPEALVAPVLQREQAHLPAVADMSRAAQLLRLLRLASQTAEICLAPDPQRPTLMPPLLPMGRQIGIEASDLLPLCDDVVQDWADWSSLLEMAAQSVPPFADLLKKAQPLQPASTDAATQAAGQSDAAPSSLPDLQQFTAEITKLQQRVDQEHQRDLENEKRMELALSGSELGTWDWNTASGEVVLNERWCTMLGYRSREVVPHLDTWKKLVHPDDYRQVLTDMRQHMDGHSQVYENEHRLLHKSGHWIWVLDRGRVMERDANGVALRVVGTHMDITQRKQVQAELLRSNRELEQFSYSISHDMRQPLRMINSYLQLLQKSLGQGLTAEQRAYFKFAIDGAQRMETMMLALLDYSRVGRKGEPEAWVQSRALVDEAVHFLQAGITESGAQLQLLGHWPQIFVSPDEMLRLMQNLIANALKFRINKQAPHITVTSTLTASHWQLCVADNGIGIQPDQIGRLFQVFSRLQSRIAFEGTGIGLALCRKIAEHHGGRIWAESAGVGLGSQFCVALPQSADVPSATTDAAP
jgi:PAS domain S-box-containing protein